MVAVLKEPVRHGCDYLSRAFGDAEELVANALDKLRGVEFDTFVGTGLSGTLVAPLLARAMGKNFLIVRKEADRQGANHSEHLVEGLLGDAWLFVDDLVASGGTLRRVRRVIAGIQESTFAGTYLYGAKYTSAEFTGKDYYQ